MGKAKKVGIGIGITVGTFFVLAIIAASITPENDIPQNESIQQTSQTESMVEVQKPEGNTTANENSDNIAISENVVIQKQTSESVRIYDLTFRLVNATQDDTKITVFVNVENHGQSIEYISWGDFRLIDSQKQLYEDSRLFPDDGEIAPSANSDFKYIFRVSEGTQLRDYQLVVLEDWNNPRYLELI